MCVCEHTNETDTLKLQKVINFISPQNKTKKKKKGDTNKECFSNNLSIKIIKGHFTKQVCNIDLECLFRPVLTRNTFTQFL